MTSKIFLGCSCVHVSETEKGKLYVCNSEALIDGQKLSEAGEGPTLETARQNANKNLGNLVSKYEEKTIGNIVKSGNSIANRNEISKEMLNGGGDKPISPRQKQLIYDRANQSGQDAENLARECYGKKLSEMTGSEANSLIRNLING